MMILVLFLATGCKNSCQQLCSDIQDYAKECGYDFSQDMLKQCYQDHKGSELEKGEAGSCRDIAPNIRDEWTCDDFADYFDAPPASGDTGQ